MAQVLKAVKRELSTKKSTRKDGRKNGMVPTVVYGFGQDNLFFDIDALSLMKVYKSGDKVITLETETESFNVIIKEIQRHPVTWQPLHVDLIKLVEGREVEVKVPLRYSGVPFGVKNMGGVLIINSRDTKVKCLPENIPNVIEVDVSPLKISETIHAGDLKLDNMKLSGNENQLLARCSATRASLSAKNEASSKSK
ncbi:MAG: 50S ribosomal protein L25 [Candidatus Delongbacteria bacterium]|nr:50S ribosomal protein L25 [Candidatus Delongbacteria bacterium]MBN2835026.1 50S ribosomal protein L25 [Candidatus Delongbacteria bacterium]